MKTILKQIAASAVFYLASSSAVVAATPLESAFRALPFDTNIESLYLDYINTGYYGATNPLCVKSQLWVWARSGETSAPFGEAALTPEVISTLPTMCEGGNTKTCESQFKIIAKSDEAEGCSFDSIWGFELSNFTIPNLQGFDPSITEPTMDVRVEMFMFDAAGNIIGVVHPEKQLSLLTKKSAPSGPNEATEEELRSIIITRSEKNIPFSTSIRLGFDHRTTIRRVKNVAWEVSHDDGNSWEPELMRNGKPVTRARFGKRYTERSHDIYRATYELDGEQWSTEEKPVYALKEAKVRIDGPNVTYSTHPITLQGTITNDVTATLQWKIYSPKNRKEPFLVVDGATYTLEGLAPGGYIVELNSTEDPAFFEGHPAYGRAQQVVTVVPEKQTITPVFKGLRNVKVGKGYSYFVGLPGAFNSARARHDLTIDGTWTMPDGSSQTGPLMSFTPSAEQDYTITFTGHITQLPDVTIAGELKLKATNYVWPEWTMETALRGSAVPVRFTGNVKMADVAAGRKGIGDEVPQLEWTLPSTARIVAKQKGILVADLVTPGNQTISVRIFDTLGHETILTSDPIVVADSAPDFQFDAYATFDGNDDLAPAKGVFKLSVSKVPTNDKFDTFRIMDGTTVLAETKQKTITLPFEAAGTRNLTLEAVTKFGVSKLRDIAMVVREAPAPTCGLAITSQNNTSWKIASNCRVGEGKITKMEWAFGERTSTGTALTAELRKADYPNGALVSVTATTNKGKTVSSTLQITP